MAGQLTERGDYSFKESLYCSHRGDFSCQVQERTAGGEFRTRGDLRVRLHAGYSSSQESGRRNLQLPVQNGAPFQYSGKGTCRRNLDHPLRWEEQILLCPRQRPTPYPQPGLGVYENTRLDSGNNRQVCIQRRTGCVGPRALQSADRHFSWESPVTPFRIICGRRFAVWDR